MPGQAAPTPTVLASGPVPTPKAGSTATAGPGSSSAPGATTSPSSSNLPAGEAGTTSGIFQGTTTSGIDVFKGIPYAQPPTGNLRWAAPKALASPLPGVTQATAFKPACEQTVGATYVVTGTATNQSEDCLYLDVYAPASFAVKKPVEVWIYGGAYIDGYADNYDGTPYAENGIVFVTFDYRLGIFGFFAHPGLDAESPHHTSDNQGLLDQVAALQWVHDNIAAFGGDPAQVTIAGESAGGGSIASLLDSPLAHGLFNRAILESPVGWHPEYTTAQQEAYFSANFPGYSQSIATLRALPTEAVLQAAPMGVAPGLAPSTPLFSPGTYFPTVDGYFLPKSDRAIVESGGITPADVIVGNCPNEGLVFTMESFAEYETDPTFQSYLGTTYGTTYGPEAVALYPVPGPTDAIDQLGQVVGDILFNDNSLHVAQAEVAKGRRAWHYVFTRPEAGQMGPDKHTCEIPFVFPGLYPAITTGSGVVPDPSASPYATMIVNAWSQFIKTGNPNGNGVSNWPAETSNDPYVDFSASGPVSASGYRTPQLDLVDQYLNANGL